MTLNNFEISHWVFEDIDNFLVFEFGDCLRFAADRELTASDQELFEYVAIVMDGQILVSHNQDIGVEGIRI